MARIIRYTYYFGLQLTWLAVAASIIGTLTSCGRDDKLTEGEAIEGPILDPLPPPPDDCMSDVSSDPLMLEGPQTTRSGDCTALVVSNNASPGAACMPYATPTDTTSSTDPYFGIGRSYDTGSSYTPANYSTPSSSSSMMAGSDLPVMLGSTSGRTAFYRDSKCQQQIAGIYIPAGYTSARFYFKHNKGSAGWQTIWITAAEWAGSVDTMQGSLSRHISMEVWVR